MSILLNNACNLKCRHCYLDAPSYGPALTHSEWSRFFRSLLEDVAPAALCIAGKEPFLNGRSVRVLQEAVRLRNDLQPQATTLIGVITNGTLIHRHRATLQQVAPDYFDVSVDGLPKAHDDIRGRGAFDQLAPNLRWLLAHFGPERVWIAHTVTSSTAANLPEVVRFYSSEFGVRRFSVGLYLPVPHGDPRLALSGSESNAFGPQPLEMLATVDVPGTVEVTLDLDVKHPAFLASLASTGWVDDSEPVSETVHRFENGVTLRVRSSMVEVGLWRAVRVTPEGHWLAAEDLADVHNYEANAVARLRDHDYDARRLYEAGLLSHRCRRPSLESSVALAKV